MVSTKIIKTIIKLERNTMALSLLVVINVLFHFLLLSHQLISSMQPSCHDEERNALIQFNKSFKLDCRSRPDPYFTIVVHPKTSSWGSNNGTNCCSWDGVDCDVETGHVIGLYLNGSCLYGSFHSNNTIFQLVHLQELDLSYNNFTFSPIPTAMGFFPELTFLSLRSSFFQGQIPSQLSLLSKLSHLDLSYNTGVNDPSVVKNLLKLKNPNLGSLVQNLTALDTLSLNYVDMGYELGGCGLYGPIPSSLGKLTQLYALNLKENDFTGYIPSFVQNLTHLSLINLKNNQISGPIPSWFGNLTAIQYIYFYSNKLIGSIPPSLFKLNNLEDLELSHNSLSGTLQLDSFLKLRNLAFLGLSYNMISLHIEEQERDPNTTLSNIKFLSLASCNLSKFPEFIGDQTNLEMLDLSNNNIYGQIPQNLMNSSLQRLEEIDISNNLITGFHNHQTMLPWSSLRVLKIQSNLLEGQLPVLPSSVIHYDASDNILSGEIPKSICDLSSILILDLSNNNLSGEFPRCSGGMISGSIIALNLRNNSFHGTIPLECQQQESDLRMVDFSHNNFQGKLQRPFATCVNLEFLDFSYNQISDVFPTWLGSFPLLKVVLMRENKFHGVIGKPEHTKGEFPMLQIIDVSHNYFTGALPSEYMLLWDAMKAFKVSDWKYMNAGENVTYNTHVIGGGITLYNYSTTFVMKSVATSYGKIPANLAVIDLSSNNFSGQIPESIGSLKALYSLNLSNNALTGHIPPSLGTLTELESLDLSQNQLSGKIPQQLAELKFLQKFDVSYNNLIGLIPQENQFHTFENTSFEGNQGLCGDPLWKKCENGLLPPSSALDKDADSNFSIELDWKFALAGLVSGLVIGVSLGEMVIPRTRLAWLIYFSRTRLAELMIRN
ncbi:receptor-like protein 48 [Humulus lupulus]|uniref:receptor-like protein 48 n=1 Tax=Humulus lupulus TaxID=3486 RepID=UPI002B40D5E1|nr:receptor-like protein 48 [Humulus lupulus]